MERAAGGPVPHARRWAAAATAIAVGAAIGTVGRNLPTAIALALFPHLFHGPAAGSCDMEAALDCAFTSVPDVVGALVRIGLLLLGVTALLAAAGIVVALVAGDQLARRPAPPAEVKWAAALAAGIALVTPLVWLAVAVAAYAVR